MIKFNQSLHDKINEIPDLLIHAVDLPGREGNDFNEFFSHNFEALTAILDEVRYDL